MQGAIRLAVILRGQSGRQDPTLSTLERCDIMPAERASMTGAKVHSRSSASSSSLLASSMRS